MQNSGGISNNGNMYASVNNPHAQRQQEHVLIAESVDDTNDEQILSENYDTFQHDNNNQLQSDDDVINAKRPSSSSNKLKFKKHHTNIEHQVFDSGADDDMIIIMNNKKYSNKTHNRKKSNRSSRNHGTTTYDGVGTKLLPKKSAMKKTHMDSPYDHQSPRYLPPASAPVVQESTHFNFNTHYEKQSPFKYGYNPVAQEYERAVVFRLGRIIDGGHKGPGIFFVLPCVDTYLKVDLRTVTFDVPPQEILTKDSVTVSVDAVVYFRIFNAVISVINVEDAAKSTKLLAASTLRNVLGTKSLHEILSDRETVASLIQSTLLAATSPWGVQVERVEVKDVRLPVQLQRAMATEAEAAREARAKVIAAEGEKKASYALKDAAQVINQSPTAIQLRYLQTLTAIASERNSTIVFPIPLELLSFLQSKQQDLNQKRHANHNTQTVTNSHLNIQTVQHQQPQQLLSPSMNEFMLMNASNSGINISVDAIDLVNSGGSKQQLNES